MVPTLSEEHQLDAYERVECYSSGSHSRPPCRLGSAKTWMVTLYTFGILSS